MAANTAAAAPKHRSESGATGIAITCLKHCSESGATEFVAVFDFTADPPTWRAGRREMIVWNKYDAPAFALGVKMGSIL